MIPGVLFKIQAKSASRVLPHDRAFCCPLHINNQLFVEVQAATMGMNYCQGYRDEGLLVSLRSGAVYFQYRAFCPVIVFDLSGPYGFRFKCSSESQAYSVSECSHRALTFSTSAGKGEALLENNWGTI